MELSSGSPNSQDFTRGRSTSNSPLTSCLIDNETIDINNIQFGNDETWLCSTHCNHDGVTNLCDWLRNRSESSSGFLSNISSVDVHKDVDTRTFTRPKKKYCRPSIERYNNDMYGSSSDTNTFGVDSKSYVIEENVTEVTKPVFDLSQSFTTKYFDKMLADSEQTEPLQNMSPPSLANSMCSSTFANLMENSYIKNDPVLSEILNTDYSESILLQDLEPPSFYSFNESCSLNTDPPEKFLKKFSINGTSNISKENQNNNLNLTFDTDEAGDITFKNTKSSDLIEPNDQTIGNANGTYRRTPKVNGTFKKSDLKKSLHILRSTFEVEPQDELHSNKTVTLIQPSESMENLKKDLSEPSEIIHTDINRLSYCIENVHANETYNKEINKTSNMTASALTGSADSLDRLSSVSSSSRGSNKMPDLDTAVVNHELDLRQIMSTPVVATSGKPKKLWDISVISPIISGEATSDSDFSSTDDYKSVRSSPSSKTSVDNYTQQQIKRLGFIEGPIQTKIKPTKKSTYTAATQKPISAVRSTHNTKLSSYSNSKNSHIPGSNSNIHKLTSSKIVPATISNLKSMEPGLKGSYTSLRPMSANLPVAPPLVTPVSKVHQNSTSPSNKESKNVVQASQVQPKTSYLPRPSGIPRPSTTSSRIPAPRSNNLRPISSRTAYSKRVSKHLTQ